MHLTKQALGQGVHLDPEERCDVEDDLPCMGALGATHLDDGIGMRLGHGHRRSNPVDDRVGQDRWVITRVTRWVLEDAAFSEAAAQVCHLGGTVESFEVLGGWQAEPYDPFVESELELTSLRLTLAKLARIDRKLELGAAPRALGATIEVGTEELNVHREQSPVALLDR